MAQQLTLPDGRIMDYARYGDPNGFDFIYFHGTPGAYNAAPASFMRACKAQGLHVTAISRPGWGGSSRHAGRSVRDIVSDVEALKKHLGIEKCLVGGWSGGGPSVLACATLLDGCIGALCVAGVAPYGMDDLDFLAGQGADNIDEFNATFAGEATLRPFLDAQRPEMMNTTAAGIMESMASILPEADKKVLLEDKEFGDSLAAGFHEALRVGVDGWVDDDLEMMKDWGFAVEDVKVPVILYQGSEDKMVPYAHGEWLAKHLPEQHLRKHLLEGEGHISIFLGRENEMVKEMLEIVKAQ